MRPIKLKIKGINSFIEEQIIDFEKLTSRGLFGIFGPTGSGKSTILDGITLALYGDVSRKSNNYINMNTDKASVSFEFQISGADTRRYIVQREFKTDSKTGNPRSGKCKVIDITEGVNEVLADTVGSVNLTCKEIIGLNLDDFTRTVVLPQGKFSDFLKLEGKARRDMLERLFNLQRYGDDLAIKLSKEIAKERTENSLLLGELKGYEDITEENKRLKELELNNLSNKYSEAVEEFKKLEKVYSDAKELWDLQLELLDYEIKKNQLIEKENQVNNSKKIIKDYEVAEKLIPYIRAYEGTLKDSKVTEEKFLKLKLEFERVKTHKELIEDKWKNIRLKKDNELPDLNIRLLKIKEALEEKEFLNKLCREIKEVKVLVDNYNKELKEKEEYLVVVNKKLEEINLNIKNDEVSIEEIKIDYSFKEKITEGVRLSEKYRDISSIVNNNKMKIDKINSLLERDKANIEVGNSKLKEKLEFIREKEEALNILLKNNPGNQDNLLKLQENLSESKEKWSRYNRLKEDLDKNNINLNNCRQVLSNNSNRKLIIEEEIKELRLKIKEIEIENLAHKLREELLKGDPCPVCGSKEHNVEDLKKIDISDYSEVNLLLENKEIELKKIEGEVTKLETNISIVKGNIEEIQREINSLGEDFKKATVQELENEFNKFQQLIKKYDLEKEELESYISKGKEEVSIIREKISSISSAIAHNEGAFLELSKEYKINFNNQVELQNKLDILIKATNVMDFINKYEEILALEKKREELELRIKSNRESLERGNLKIREVENIIKDINENLVKNNTELLQRERLKIEKEEGIKNKVGNIEDLQGLLNEINNTIGEIELEFSKTEEEKEKIHLKYNEINEELIREAGRLTELNIRKEKEKSLLDEKLKENDFLNIEEVKSKLISEDTLRELKNFIEKYNEDLAKIFGAIESISNKIGDRNINEEEWINIQSNKDNREIEIKEINEEKIKIEEELRLIKDKFIQLGELLKKKEKLDHKLALLNHLEKLFKGKKFVEYVAATRLKYIALEASKKLREITNEIYALEVDENGKFIIRDYKNGGSKRDASTLSGGETFLTSLALALALSAEIQLKGTAPLELFFLDEGFGTLDDELLEVVMNSLEKIHNDKLKVGIISHVESIKNRVPIKLILTPAEAGRGGSKVKIDIN